MAICYLNTDLDLTSSNDLTPIAAALESRGVRPLHVTRGEDGLWYATFETEVEYEEPEPNISAMLAVVELLGQELMTVWFACTRREFNIGYDCGGEPWAFNQGLSSELLSRIAQARASLRITLYPPEKPSPEGGPS